jgi:hypothetical protein
VVVLNHIRKSGKDLAVLRLLDVRFDGRQAAFAGRGKQLVKHLERLLVSLLGKLRPSHGAADTLQDLLQYMRCVGDQHRSDSGTENDDQLRWLHQYAQVALFHQVAGNHRSEYKQNSDNLKHKEFLVSASPRR